MDSPRLKHTPEVFAMASLKKRGQVYYGQYYVGKKQRRVSFATTNYQVAKAKLRKLEDRLASGDDNPMPTRTPIDEVLTAYVQQIRTVKTPKSAQTDIYYLRETFGPICDALSTTSRRLSGKTRKRKKKFGQDRRCRPHVIEAACFEAIATRDIAEFIGGQVRSRGLAPKTANRYREILTRLFNWAMGQGVVRLPSGTNPAAKVERYKERAGQIRFLTLAQIDEQLLSLRFNPKLQAMVAVLIYAGLRREELLWLTLDDIDLNSRNGGHGIIRVRAKAINEEFWQPKTKANRAVPISKSLRSHLDRYTPSKSDHGWFFPSPEGKRWDVDNFSRSLRRANREAGLPWGCLDYRHTFGSQLAQRDVSLYKIATLMGNSPEICRRHYAALVPEAMIGEIDFTTAHTADRIGVTT